MVKPKSIKSGINSDAGLLVFRGGKKSIIL
jgi:hypothetical protein